MTREELLKLKDNELITCIVGKDIDGKDRIHVYRFRAYCVQDDHYYTGGMEYRFDEVRRTGDSDFQRLYKQEELRHNQVVNAISKLQNEYLSKED